VITVLAGGVGAARFLAGLVRVADPSQITAVVNVGDDLELHGLRISPDLDTIVYTLAGAIDVDRGWGLAGESWQAMETLDRYGGITWFRLGDRDLGTHLYRTSRLREGAGLTTVAGEIARAWGLEITLLPATEDVLRTRVTLPDHGGIEVGFQEYFVERRHDVRVSAIRFDGANEAVPAPGVLAALLDSEGIVIAPSNPLVSIAPVLAVPGIRATVEARRDQVVAISPIVAGAALKGPADRLMRELGHEASVVGVARLYAPMASVLLVDEADADQRSAVEAEGMRCVVTPTVMSGPEEAAALGRAARAAIR
jgi:LPPG:FO 2-phospho-L-lactate transferase